MKFFIFERFLKEQDSQENQKKDYKTTLGEKWNEIDVSITRFKKIDDKYTIVLDCDFRMPHMGYIWIPHPTYNTKRLELAYSVPCLKIPNYRITALTPDNITMDLKREWEELPATHTIQLGTMNLILKKDIVDLVEASIDGNLYLYKPARLCLTL